MAYLLGKGSAVEWLRMSSGIALTEQFVLPLLALEGSRTRLQRHPQLLDSLTQPLHLIVATRENRRPSVQATCHLLVSPTGYYPALRVERGVFCSTPAFAFLQMASELDSQSLLFLGMELCGRYGIDTNGSLFLRTQSCTPTELVDCARQMQRVRGRRQALQVAPLVVGNSASPMETALTLILSQPVEMGGFGLPVPELNKSIPVRGSARRLWDDDFIAPDMLWEEGKLALEYDSSLHHSSEHRRARDSTRRDVLVEMGYRVVSVNGEHLRTPRAMENIAGIVAQQLGIELVECDEETWGRRLAFQLLMRDLAEHPEKLLAFPKQKAVPQRGWHARTNH